MMRFFKTVLVLLLALLLPIKGAVAAAGMACTQTSHPAQQTLAAAGSHHGAAIDTHVHNAHVHNIDAHDAPPHDASAAHRHARDAGEPDHAQSVEVAKTCSVCAACSASTVSLPPSRARIPLFAAPSGKAAAPSVLAYPSHISAGLERPPRSL